MAEPYSETGLTLALDAAQSQLGLQLAGEDVPNLYDATGENLWSGSQERDVNGQRVVTYRLSGRPPYVMNLYNLSGDPLQTPVTLLDGAALIAAAPTVTPGDGVTVTSSLSSASLVFNLDAPEGTRVGYLIDLPPDLRDALQFSLLTNVYNGSGEVMSNIRDGAPDRVQAYGLQPEVYTLTGPAPYTLEIRRSGDDLPPFDLATIPDDIYYQLLHRTASAMIEARRFNARNAVRLVHSFSPAGSWFAEYARFLALFTVAAHKDTLHYLNTVDGIELFAGWVSGDPRFLAL
jgi:hypothetical protein